MPRIQHAQRTSCKANRLADRAAEKSIIDPSVSASHSTYDTYAIPRVRIFGVFRHVRVIRTRCKTLLHRGFLSSSKPRPTVEKEKERWNGSRATGKTMPRCCMTFTELSFRFLKNESLTRGVEEESMKNCIVLPNFGTFFPNFFATRRFTEINGCEPDMEKREIDEF